MLSKTKLSSMLQLVSLIFILSACSSLVLHGEKNIPTSMQTQSFDGDGETKIQAHTPASSPTPTSETGITETPAADDDSLYIGDLPSGLFIASMSAEKDKIFVRGIEGQIIGTLLSHSLNGDLDPSSRFLIYESNVLTTSAVELLGYAIALFDMEDRSVIPIDVTDVHWDYGIPGDWSPDGDYIVLNTMNISTEIFTRIGLVNVQELKAYDIDLWNGEATDPDWSPNGEFIAFSSYHFSENNLISSIFLLDSICISELKNCSDYVTSLFSDEKYSYYYPSWAPDSEHLVFGCFNEEKEVANLCIGDLETGEIWEIPNTEVLNIDPSWSPDGEWISTSADGDIYIISPDGSETRKISESEQFLFWILVP